MDQRDGDVPRCIDGYEILSVIRKRSFATVFKASQTGSNQKVALKRFKQLDEKTKRLIEHEVGILNHLKEIHERKQISKESIGCLPLVNHLLIEERVLAFELLSVNLHMLSRMTNHRGLPLPKTRNIAQSLLRGLNALYTFGIVHANIKPEHIVLQRPDRTSVKIVDFGRSWFQSKKPPFKLCANMQSRFYRAPEVLLNRRPFTAAIDMWSFGCVIAELHLGHPLLPGADKYDQFAQICGVPGWPPSPMLEGARESNIYCNRFGMPRYCSCVNEDNQTFLYGSKSRSGEFRGVPGYLDLKQALNNCQHQLFVDSSSAV